MSLRFLKALLIVDPLIVITTIVMGTISILSTVFDSSGHAAHRVARHWSRALLWLAGVRVRVEGLEKIDPRRSYVLVSNHLSLMDTPVAMGCIPLEFRFFAKKGLFSIPFLGTHLKRAGHLPVVRGEPRAQLKSISDAAGLIRERGISLLLFPEGGRAPGPMREFKEGAAYLAIKAGVPVVPMGIAGTREVLPMGSIQVMPGRVTLRIGDPISTSGLTVRDRAELTQILRDRVAELTGNQPAPAIL